MLCIFLKALNNNKNKNKKRENEWCEEVIVTRRHAICYMHAYIIYIYKSLTRQSGKNKSIKM